MTPSLLKGIIRIQVISFQGGISPAEPKGMPGIEIITVNNTACRGW